MILLIDFRGVATTTTYCQTRRFCDLPPRCKLERSIDHAGLFAALPAGTGRDFLNSPRLNYAADSVEFRPRPSPRLLECICRVDTALGVVSLVDFLGHEIVHQWQTLLFSVRVGCGAPQTRTFRNTCCCPYLVACFPGGTFVTRWNRRLHILPEHLVTTCCRLSS